LVRFSVSAALTVADSKRAFHRAFPYVIAPLYRRMVDELLVELHLLSRQSGFRNDPLFACGLIQVFDSFGKGYRPDAQREPLLAALCSASGFDAAALRQQRAAATGSGAPAPSCSTHCRTCSTLWLPMAAMAASRC